MMQLIKFIAQPTRIKNMKYCITASIVSTKLRWSTNKTFGDSK